MLFFLIFIFIFLVLPQTAAKGLANIVSSLNSFSLSHTHNTHTHNEEDKKMERKDKRA